MGSVGAPELIVIFLVALIVLGPDKLPKAARQVGKAVAEFKRISSGFQDEVRKAIDLDEPGRAGSEQAGSAQAGSEQGGPGTPAPGDNPFAGRQASSSSPDVDLPPPPDDPSRN